MSMSTKPFKKKKKSSKKRQQEDELEAFLGRELKNIKEDSPQKEALMEGERRDRPMGVGRGPGGKKKFHVRPAGEAEDRRPMFTTESNPHGEELGIPIPFKPKMKLTGSNSGARIKGNMGGTGDSASRSPREDVDYGDGSHGSQEERKDPPPLPKGPKSLHVSKGKRGKNKSPMPPHPGGVGDIGSDEGDPQPPKQEAPQIIVNQKLEEGEGGGSTSTSKPEPSVDASKLHLGPKQFRKKKGTSTNTKELHTSGEVDHSSSPRSGYASSPFGKRRGNSPAGGGKNTNYKPKMVLPAPQPSKEKIEDDEYDDYFDDFQDSDQEEKNKEEKTVFQAISDENKRVLKKNKIKPLGITKGLVQYDKSKLVDQSALNEQKKRTMKIKEFVNLQVETFDDMLEIKPVSTFDNYFQRLTSGNIQNMLVQTGDNVNSKETQTETTTYTDATQNCPDDRHVREDYLLGSSNFDNFLTKTLPMIEAMVSKNASEAHNLDTTISKKQIDLLGHALFPETLTKIFKIKSTQITGQSICEMPAEKISISYKCKLSNNLNLDICILFPIGSKNPTRILYFPEEITSTLPITNTLFLGGTISGALYLFNLLGSKPNNLPEMVINSLPEDISPEVIIDSMQESFGSSLLIADYSTELIREKHEGEIVSLRSLHSSKTYTIISADITGNICFWRLNDMSKVDPLNTTDLGVTVFASSTLEFNMRVIHSDGLSDVLIYPKDPNMYIMLADNYVRKGVRYEIGGGGGDAFDVNSKQVLDSHPTAIGLSDEGLFLVGFQCGSLALYAMTYSMPLTIWYNIVSGAIKHIQWNSVYFPNLEQEVNAFVKTTPKIKQKALPNVNLYFKNNVSEFLILDDLSNLYFWNLLKDVKKHYAVIDLKKYNGGKCLRSIFLSETYYNQCNYISGITQENTVVTIKLNQNKSSLGNFKRLFTVNSKAKKIISSLPNNYEVLEILDS